MRKNWMLVGVLVSVALLASACGGGGARDAGEAAPPNIEEISPSTGGIGGNTAFTIWGTGLANQGVGISEVLIGARPVLSVIVVSDRQMDCKSPPGTVGSFDVTVTNNGGTDTMVGGYTYYPAPTLTSVDPTEGSLDGGDVITLTGSGFFVGEPGEPTVLLASMPCKNVNVLSDSLLEATTPESFIQQPVDVTVINRYGQDTLVDAYTIKGPAPVLLSVDPNLGSTDGFTLVELTGENFAEPAGTLRVLFNGFLASEVHIDDGEHLTCKTPPSDFSGPVDVDVTNENGIATLENGFTYIPPPFEVTGIQPDGGDELTVIPCTITGQGFERFNAGQPTVIFTGSGGAQWPADNAVATNDVVITCDSPELPEDIYDVTVTNNRGTETLVDAFEVAGWYVPTWDSDYGTNLMLADDTNGTTGGVTTGFPGGVAVPALSFTFPFFGVEHTDFNINSNGYMNFGGSYNNYTGAFSPTYPQMSLIAEDLNPGAAFLPAPAVYAKATADTYVVTYVNVPFFSATGAHTAQLHVRPDGQIAMLWQTINYGGGLDSLTVGLSPSGTPSGSDLSTPWLTEPPIAPDWRRGNTYNATAWNLTGKILTFRPDGSGGYITKISNL